jgi:SWI/SNF-related matrix-associated actin-dependent regulator of chromatin subfamily A member 2/4
MLARSEAEFELYQRMDLERRREEARQGTARKPRLMEESELPEWMSKDEEEVERLTCEEEEERVFGRGNRQRKDVDYGDSLTEREWLKAIGASLDEDGNAVEDDDEEDAGPSSRRKKGRPSGSGRKRRADDGGDDEEEPSSKKRRGPKNQPSMNPRLKRKMEKILQMVMKHTDAEGRILSQPFMKLPTRKELPDYYEVIKRPIDIHKIMQHVANNKYQVRLLVCGGLCAVARAVHHRWCATARE